MPAPQVILDLVARFVEHKETYKSSSYNETQVRRDFIDPFFRELGWDVDNSAGYAEAYRDVVHEDSVKVSGATKAPDYGFRIGGQRKFFLEAKKPSISIKNDIGPAYQLRRYAWSAKLPLSVLTDFEEFAVYDCNKKPLPSDAASKGRILYFTFDQYAEKWDEIAGVFSKEAVLKGSFDKFAVTAKGKRGTTAVDEEFLATIEEWRADLARNLAIRNPLLTQRELNFSVQRVIDRIIFLRICEDRGIEDYGRLRLATEEKGAIYPRLVQLFKQADERYNSGLFHFNEEKGRNEAPDSLTPELEVDDSTLKKIIRGLYYPESPYEFRVLSADILGSVYEQFLGKVIRLTESHQAKIEEKPEVKKAGGVYYTPTYIVDYIVKQTVGPLLEGKTPKQIEKVHILDPACGSGSFLIGTYQFLLDWYQRYYTENEPEILAKGKTPQIVASPGGGYELTIPERKRILTTHLYGVDLDSQAVEVTKLSLLLKVLEGETAQRLQRELIQERVLPDLDDNIKCGNSLIASDYYAQPGLPAMDTEDHLRINVFDWDGKDGFPEIMKSGGFDAVIGNPPYGIPFSRLELDYLVDKNPNTKKFPDSYCLFMEHVMKLLGANGLLGFIVPNTFCDLESSADFRKMILKHWCLKQISQSGWAFKDAVVDTLVFISSNQVPSLKHNVKIEIGENEYFREQASFLSQELHKIDYRNSIKDRILAENVISRCAPLSEFASVKAGVKMYEKGKGNPPQTEETMKSRPYSMRGSCPDGWLPLYRGLDINRYELKAPAEFVSYGNWLAAPRSPELFEGSRILMRRTDDRILASLETSTSVCVNSCHIIKLIDSKPTVREEYILGILNSKLLQKLFEIQNPQMVGKVFAEIKVVYVERLPIRCIDFTNSTDIEIHDQIVSLVDQMMSLHKLRSGIKTPHEQTATDRQISAIDSQIDREVYALYGLTDEEIKLVEATA
jgi:hypothetical protein